MPQRFVGKAVLITGAAGGLGDSLDLDLVSARGNVDAEPLLDRDQILVIFAEQAAEQLRLFEQDFEAGAIAGLGGNWLAAHSIL